MAVIISNCCVFKLSLLCVISVLLIQVTETEAGPVIESPNSCSAVKLRFTKRGFAASEFPTDPIEGKSFFLFYKFYFHPLFSMFSLLFYTM